MKILKHKNIEFSEVYLSELGQEMRFDGDYWDPFYLRNEDIIKSKTNSLIKHIAPSPQYGISIAMNEDGKGYYMLKMDNIMEMLAEDKDAKYAEISKKTFSQFQLKKYDVLFNRVNSDEFVGRTGIYLMDGDHTFASYLVRIDSGLEYTNCYITAYLNCKYGKIALQRVKRRAVNQANINAKELSNLTIPIPSETLQKAIQRLIEEAQAQKELSEKLYKEAEQILLSELGLENWKPKTKKFNLHGVEFEVEDTENSINSMEIFRTDRIDAEYWNKNFINFIDLIKSYKPFKLLKDFVISKPGFAFKSDDFSDEFFENCIQVLRIQNVKDKGIDLTSNPVYLSDEFRQNYKSFLIKRNDLIFSMTGGKDQSNKVGKAFVFLEAKECLLNQRVLKVQMLDYNDIVSEFVLSLLINIVNPFIIREAGGSIQSNISEGLITKMPIPIIDKKIQNIANNKIIASIDSANLCKNLLEISKRAVEIFIEENEEKAMEFINNSGVENG